MASPFEIRGSFFDAAPWEVIQLRGREGVSRLYAFDVVAASPAEEIGAAALRDALLGEAVSLSLGAAGEAARTISGIVSSATLESALRPSGPAAVHAHLRLRIVPRMWLLRRTRNSRIFQDETVKDIVTRVLSSLRIPFEWRLQQAPKPRAYCVQYQESDHDFVTRILAEEGIFYFFAAAPAGAAERSDVVVLCDEATYPSIGGQDEAAPLLFRPADDLRPQEEPITRLTARRRVRSESVHLRDYDFMKPLLEFSATAAKDGAAARAGSLQVYDHVSDYDEPEVRDDRAKRLLAQLRRRAESFEGESLCRKLAPGHRFVLAEHPEQDLNRAFAVTAVTHEGNAPSRPGVAASGDRPVYSNRFECVAAEAAYLPRRPRPKTNQVMETAIVVGPKGEEIHTDRHGRVKVQFHWDRDGARNEHSSCWMRVSQAWAGSSWGFQFIPRIGMEVLVSFLGGDTDRPVVVGCLYNPLSPPSHDLPLHATKSGIRTRTSPGPDGYNELSFEDQRGKEQIYLHAERDLAEVVNNDHVMEVGRFDPEEPSGNQKVRVAHDQSTEVGRNRLVTVRGDQQHTIFGGRADVIKGGARLDVDGSIETTCDHNMEERVAVSRTSSVGADLVSHVGGNLSHVTGGNQDAVTHGHNSLRVDGYMTRTVLEDYTLHAVQGVSLSSNGGLRLACGDSTIDLGPREIVITAPKVTVIAAETATTAAEHVVVAGKTDTKLFGPHSELALSDSNVTAAAKQDIKLFSSKASVVLDVDAAIDGSFVKLNCGGKHEDPEEHDPEAVSWVDVELTRLVPKQSDPTQTEHKGVPGARFLVYAADGRIYRGVLDDEGRARVAVPPGYVSIVFPDEEQGRIKPQ